MNSAVPSESWVRHLTGDLIVDGKLSIGDGYRAKNSELALVGLPFARAGNIAGGFHFDDADRFPADGLAKVGEKVSQPGDVVFTSKGTVGRLAYVCETTPRFVYSPQLCYWRSLDRDLIDSRWLYYWMFGQEFRQQISGVKGQTDMADYVSLTDQRRMDITIPSIRVQHAIAGVLGALDDKIEQNRRTARTLERLARAIFRAWFVDFEPVKAKAAGATSFPSMPQPVLDALPTRLVDSEIGPVPEGWEVGIVADLGEVICGKTPPTNKPENYGNDVYFITIPDMHGKVSVTDTGKKLSFTGANTQKQKYLPANSICVSCIATPGLVVITSDRAQTNQQINSIIPREDLSPYYCYETLSRLGAQIRAGGSGGSVFHNLNKSRFSALKILLPPKEVISLFHGTVTPLFEKILANQKESHKLAELRDLLLPKLLSGQVRVAVDTDRPEVST